MLASRPRVRAVVDAAQALAVDVAVDLRRRERGVAEQLLDRPQVGAALEQVRRECVAQPVRMRRDPPQRARVEPAAAHREEERVLGAAARARAARARGSARATTRPPRRAGRRAPCRPCRARGRAPARSRRRRGRARPPRRCAARPSRRARRARGCAARAGRRPRAPSSSRSTSAERGGSGSRRARRGASGASGRAPGRAWSAGTSERRRAAARRSPARAASGARPSSAAYSVELAHADVVEAQLPRVEPAREVLEVDAVRAPRRVGERRAAQEAVDLALEGHSAVDSRRPLTAPRGGATTSTKSTAGRGARCSAARGARPRA